MANRRIVVEFLGKDTSLSKTAKSTETGMSRLSTTLGKLGLAFGAFEAARGTINFLKDATAEARESQKVNALTANTIKTTGGAAKVTAKEVGNLATAISNKTGIDDEAVQSGSNLLLTFKQIRNEAGKGNAIFDRATQAAVDLSKAGFGSITSTSKQLGKALNDPIKGMSALGRAGVTFTDSQKKQIKAMVKQGDLLGAQKIMLKEVESQVGGAAEASATAGEKLATRWANFKEQVGTALLPVIDKTENFLANKLIPALSDAGDTFSKVRDKVQPFIDAFRGVGDSSGAAGQQFAQFRATVASVWSSVQQTFSSAVSIIKSLWSAFGSNLVSTMRGVLSGVMTSIRGAFTVISGIFKVFSALLRGDWKGVWEGIKQILSGARTAIVGMVNAMWAAVKGSFRAAGIAIRAIFSGIWSGIKSLATSGASTVVGMIRGIPGKLRALGGAFASAGRSLIHAFVNGLKNAGGVISGIAGNVWSAVKRLLNGAIDRINSALEFKVSIPGPDIHINPPNIPHLYTGGIVKGSMRGTPIIAGDRGHDELVMPLSGPHAPRMGGMGGGDTYVININGVLTEGEAGRKLEQVLTKHRRTIGRDLAFT